MTASIEPGTPVTVVYSGQYDTFPGGRVHEIAVERGGFYRTFTAPAEALIVPASDGSTPTVLTPAIRSLAHRAARDAGEFAPLNVAVEAALSALEPVVAGLVGRAKNAATERALDAVLDVARSQSGEDATPRAGLIGGAGYVVTGPSTGAAAEMPNLVLLDQESFDGDMTVRPSFFADRLVVAFGSGFEDEEIGEGRGWQAVALDPADVERLSAYLTEWMEKRRG